MVTLSRATPAYRYEANMIGLKEKLGGRVKAQDMLTLGVINAEQRLFTQKAK